VDGVLSGQENCNGLYRLASLEHLVIGGIDDSPGNSFAAFFTGKFYDVSIYNYDLSASQVAALAIIPDPSILVQPNPVNCYVGQTATFSVVENGTAPLTNQWQLNGTNLVDGNYGGTVVTGSSSNVLSIVNVSSSFVGSYRVLVSNTNGTATSSNSTLTIVGTTYAPPATNLVGAWLMGATNLADVSGYSPAGTHDGYGVTGTGTISTNYLFTNDVPLGAVPLIVMPGRVSVPKYGVSLWLNKGDTVIAISNSATVDAGYTNTFDDNLTNAFTVLFWAKGYPGNWNPWVSKYGEGPGWEMRDEGDNAHSGFTLRAASPGTILLGSTPYGDPEDLRGTIASKDQYWHFYAGTYSVATGVRNWYVDGVLSAQAGNNGPYNLAASEHLTIGGKDQPSGNNFTGYFTGEICGVQIYNIALDADQINYIYDSLWVTLLLPPTFDGTPTITTGSNGQQFTLRWSFGTLLQATSAAGPWTPAAGATPPYTNLINMAAPNMFYKLSNP
jgi:hypothetical protein